MSNLLNRIALGVVAFFVGLAAFALVHPSAVDSLGLQDSLAAGGSVNLLHLSYNSYLTWTIEPMIADLAQLLMSISPTWFGNGVHAVVGAIFVSGFVLLLRHVTGRSRLEVVLAASFFSAVVLWFSGSDIVILSFLAALSWLTLALLFAFRDKRSSIFALIFLAIVCIATNRITHQFALLVYIAASCLAAVLQPAYDVVRRLEAEKQKWIILICLLAPLFFSMQMRQEAQLPFYPNDAHVVSDDNVPGQVTPLVGEAPSIPFLDRKFVKNSYADLSVVLLGLAVCLSFALMKYKRELALLSWFASASLLVVVLDTAIPEAYAHIMPLFSTARILPGAFLYPLTPLFFATAIVALYFVLQRISKLLLAGVLVFLVCGLANFAGVHQRAVVEKAEAAKFKLTYGQLSLSDKALYFSSIFSPSFNVVLTEGLPTVIDARRYRQLQATPVSESLLLPATDGVTVNPVQLFDGNRATRWNPPGGQRSGEEFCLAFSQKIVISGIDLSVGNFTSDFPRGVEVINVASCAENEGEVVFRRHRWEGPVRFTQAGLAYWGWQADMRLMFEKDIAAQMLKIRQIGKNSQFDWSVAEAGIYLPAK